LTACRRHEAPALACSPPARLSKLSGQCVPRWVSLRRGDVNARKGPGEDYPALWAYHARGLPLQIVAETQIWRRVCDPDGLAAWVDRAALGDRRAVEPRGAAPVPVLGAPHDGAPVRGQLSPRALASLDRCEGAWCKVTVAGVTGWAPAADLWGAATDAQCR
jgi:SH3-like domain-containing protein